MRSQALVLHADKGNGMRSDTVKRCLEELGMLRSFSRTKGSNDNHFSESQFRTV